MPTLGKPNDEIAPINQDEETPPYEKNTLTLSYDYLYQKYSEAKNYSYQTAEYAWDSLPYPVQFVLRTGWSGVPNFEEVLYSASATTIVEKTLETWMNLGGSLAGKEIFRDMAKFPTLIISKWQGVEYGHTGYKYDEANVWAQGVKIACKLAGLGGAHAYGGPAGVQLMAPLINVVCEIPARAIIEVGRKKQKANDEDTPFLEFLADNLGAEEWIEGLTAAAAKKITASAMQVAVGNLRLHETAKNVATDADEYLLNRLFSVKADLNPFNDKHIDSFAETFSKTVTALGDRWLAKPFIFVAEATTELLTGTISGILNTFILASSARAAQETVVQIVNADWVQYHVEEHLKKGDILRNIFGTFGIISTTDTDITHDDDIPADDKAQEPEIAGKLQEEVDHQEL